MRTLLKSLARSRRKSLENSTERTETGKKHPFN
jgi:hypothetical protein